MSELLSGKSQQEVVSTAVSFSCKKGISFKMALAVSKACTDSSNLTFRLFSVETSGDYLRRLEIAVSGSIIAPDADSSVIHVKPMASADVQKQDESSYACSFDCKLCKEFSRLPSIISVSTPTWTDPLASFLNFKSSYFNRGL
jgi:hypothetical protein